MNRTTFTSDCHDLNEDFTAVIAIIDDYHNLRCSSKRQSVLHFLMAESDCLMKIFWTEVV
jgi:hypothetical protein